VLMNKKNAIASQLVAYILFASGFAAAQIDTPRIPTEQDVGDLYQRAATSVFVITGTVMKSEGVSKRMTPDLLERVKSEGDLSLTLGGTLYTILVEKTICRQTDFDAQSSNLRSTSLGETAHIFVPRRNAAYPSEALSSGQHYLLFLIVPGQQREWTDTFNLDPRQIYYRSHEGYRGVVPIPQSAPKVPTAKQPLVLDKVTQLCQAVRPTSVSGKLAALNKLAASGDPVLEKEANAAVKALQDKARPPQD
jgi:hypothetical protein